MPRAVPRREAADLRRRLQAVVGVRAWQLWHGLPDGVIDQRDELEAKGPEIVHTDLGPPVGLSGLGFRVGELNCYILRIPAIGRKPQTAVRYRVPKVIDEVTERLRASLKNLPRRPTLLHQRL